MMWLIDAQHALSAKVFTYTETLRISWKTWLDSSRLAVERAI